MKIPDHQQLPTLKAILELRKKNTQNKNNNMAFDFVVEYLAGPIIGMRKWKTERCYKPLSQVMTVSDEAFMLLLLENQYELWLTATSTRVGRGRYTKEAKNHKFCGWSNEGIRRFNDLFMEVEENRQKQWAKGVEATTVKTLANRYNKMLPLGGSETGRKRRRHGTRVNADGEEVYSSDEEPVIAKDELAIYVVEV